MRLKLIIDVFSTTHLTNHASSVCIRVIALLNVHFDHDNIKVCKWWQIVKPSEGKFVICDSGLNEIKWIELNWKVCVWYELKMHLVSCAPEEGAERCKHIYSHYNGCVSPVHRSHYSFTQRVIPHQWCVPHRDWHTYPCVCVFVCVCPPSLYLVMGDIFLICERGSGWRGVNVWAIISFDWLWVALSAGHIPTASRGPFRAVRCVSVKVSMFPMPFVSLHSCVCVPIFASLPIISPSMSYNTIPGHQERGVVWESAIPLNGAGWNRVTGQLPCWRVLEQDIETLYF